MKTDPNSIPNPVTVIIVMVSAISNTFFIFFVYYRKFLSELQAFLCRPSYVCRPNQKTLVIYSFSLFFKCFLFLLDLLLERSYTFLVKSYGFLFKSNAFYSIPFTVYARSIARGAAKIGEQLVVQPGGFEVRIRSLQSHDRDNRYRLMPTVLTICTTRSTVLFVRTTGQEVRVGVSS